MSAPSILLSIAVSTVVLGSPLVHGHHDPTDEVAALTAEIESQGATAERLLNRASRWRSLRRLDLAIADLEQAVELAPKAAGVRLNLAKAYLADDQLKTALSEAETAAKLAETGAARAEAEVLKASIHTLWKSYSKAETAWKAAFEAVPDHQRVDWYLHRAHVQRMTNQWQACLLGLKAGYEATGSSVLYTQWVEALIDAGRSPLALKEIRKQLPGLRFSAAWRIRYALASIGLKRSAQAKQALSAALEELNKRLTDAGDSPDVALLRDRAVVYLLLGDRAAAKKDYQRAKKHGAAPWMLWRLESGLEGK